MDMRETIDHYMREYLEDLYDAILSQIPSFIRTEADEAVAKTQITAFYNQLMVVADSSPDTQTLFTTVAPMMIQAETIVKTLIPTDIVLQQQMVGEMYTIRDTIVSELEKLAGG